ncbi:MAG TPA: DUF4124 domain-containing protein [Nevskiaceae bacterium]
MLLHLAAAVFLLCGVATVHAQVYSWTDAQGVTHFSDRPHTKGAQPVQLPPLQLTNDGAALKALAAQREAQAPITPLRPPVAAAPRIVQPAESQSIFGSGDLLPVTVDGTLGPDQGFIYFLDGKAQNTAPTQASSMIFTDVWRGEHTVDVAIADDDGEIVSRSEAVTLYMKQPIVYWNRPPFGHGAHHRPQGIRPPREARHERASPGNHSNPRGPHPARPTPSGRAPADLPG